MFRLTIGTRAVAVDALCLVILLIGSSGTAQARLTTTSKHLLEVTDNANAGDTADHRSLNSVTDNYGMTFVDTGGEKRDCSWLKTTLSSGGGTAARTTYCSPPSGVRTPLSALICPQTCGLPAPDKCGDSNSYIGTTKSGRLKKCKWIRAVQKRKDKYCSSEAGFNKRADVACPKTCGKCGGTTPTTTTPSVVGCNGGQASGTVDPRYQACKIGSELTCATADGVDCESLTSTMRCAENPTHVRFKFSGGQCFQSTHNQDGKMRCMSAFSGTAGLNSAVITVLGTGVPGGPFNGANHLYHTGTYNVGAEFVVKGTTALPDTPKGNVRDQMTIVIQDKEGKVRQSMILQMDCGQYKLAYRDTFGALEVKRYVTSKQGTVPTAVKVDYTYKVDNTGPLTAGITRFETMRNGLFENLLSDSGPNVGACDSVEVVKTDTIDLSKRSSYSANLAVNAQNEAGLGCVGSASVSFTAGDAS